MSSRVRLLPALIGAAGVLFALRVGAMASSAETAAPAETTTPAAAEGPEASPKVGASTPPATAAAPSDAKPGTETVESKGAAAPPPMAAEPMAAQTKGEAEVLQNLGARRAALDARERDLALREQLMGATEKRVSEHLGELRSLEGKLNTMLTQRDAAEETQLGSLVKTYENMKAPDAAKIFNKLDRKVTLDVAQRMKPAKIGAILAAMDPARAQDLTVMLATRMSLPKPPPVVAAACAPVPAPASEQPQAAVEAPSDAPHS
ncbi:MAG: hypothetical protein K8S25_05235 [Alphaproteobacteria bacterium]|nr:hypothetical protein [Alphaproteobacteria bacterium]